MVKQLILPILSVSVLLFARCSYSDNGFDDYKTPELFFSHVNRYENTTLSVSAYPEIKNAPDYQWEIKKAILDVGDYPLVTPNVELSQRFLNYHILVSNAMSGPNYSELTLHDDGFICVFYKSSLGWGHSIYYQIDKKIAASIVDMAEEKVYQWNQDSISASIQAENDGKIENFFAEMETHDSIFVIYYQQGKMTYYYDDKTLLRVLEEADYEFIGYSNSHSFDTAVGYHGASRYFVGEVHWVYQLNKAGDQVLIRYDYKDKINEVHSVRFLYSIDEAHGKQILDTVAELAVLPTT